MAKLLTKKFIGNKEIDGEKIKLLSGQSLKAESTSGTEVELLKVDVDGKVFAMGSEVGKKSEIDQVAADLATEIGRAQYQESQLDIALTNEISNRIAGDADLQNSFDALDYAFSQEVTDRTNGDADLQSQIDALSGSSGSSLSALEAALALEVSQRQAAIASEASSRESMDTALNGMIINANNAITAEGVRAVAAEIVLSTSISQEISNRQTAVSGVQSQIDAIMQGSSSSLDSFVEVVQAFEAADASLNGAITSLASSASSGLSAEVSRAEAAESAISASLSSEISRAQQAETTLQNHINDEANARGTAFSTLQSSLSSEVSRALNAEAVLSGRVDVLEAKGFEKEKKTLTSTDVSNGFVMLSHKADVKSIVAFVDRLAIHEGEDYSVSVVGGVTKITFSGDIGPSGVSPLESGDTIYFKYHY